MLHIRLSRNRGSIAGQHAAQDMLPF